MKCRWWAWIFNTNSLRYLWCKKMFTVGTCFCLRDVWPQIYPKLMTQSVDFSCAHKNFHIHVRLDKVCRILQSILFFKKRRYLHDIPFIDKKRHLNLKVSALIQGNLIEQKVSAWKPLAQRAFCVKMIMIIKIHFCEQKLSLSSQKNNCSSLRG